MTHLSDQLVGRSAELDAFDEILAGLEEGDSASIELSGEPGIGKTSLLTELANRSEARGHLVLAGSASELERELPFSVFVDALDEYAGGLDPMRLAPLGDEGRTELAHVFPRLASLDAGAGALVQNERYRTHHAIRELLEILAGPRPLVLILDDLHWADSGSVELLGALLRRPPRSRVLLAMAARTRQTPGRLSAALERAHRAQTLMRLEPAALTLAETQQLLGERVEARAIFDESGGNPFYVNQLARAPARFASAAGTPDGTSLSGVGVPSAVVAALAEELGLLSDETRLALEGAAVAGDPFEPELMAAAANVTEPAAVGALDELLLRDLVRHTDVPRRFRFRHPLVRRAVYDISPGGWRLDAHRRTAEALAARGASEVARAHHVERSARQGDATAVALLRKAGDASAQRTPAGAARWFGAALRLLSDTAPAQERVELLTALAGVQAASGQFAEARAALLESIELLPDDAIALRVQLTAACAGLEQLLGRHDDAHARLEGALDTLDARDSPQAASLMISLAIDAFFRQAYTDSREWALRSVEVARPLDDQPLTAAALAAVALACAFLETTTEAELHRREAAEVIDTLPDAELARRLDGVAYLTAAELYLDRFEEGTVHGERGLRVARATAQGELLPILTQALASVLFVQGRLSEAAELLDGAIESARLAGNDQTLAWDLLNRAYAAVELGDLKTAVAAAEESFALTRPLDYSLVKHYAGILLAIARLEEGEPAQSVELFVASGGGESLPLVPGGWKAKYLGLLARGQLRLGRPSDAERTAAEAAAVATKTGLRSASAWALRAAADVALERGDPAAAAEHALASAAAALEVGALVEAALSRSLAGSALARAGDVDRAVAELELAVAALDTHGAVRYRLDAERELGKLGHRPYRRTARGSNDGGGVDSLTARELELARLVVDRKTNSEIAAALFLSRKTVESHLRNIFRKVGVSSRVELARAVERADGTASRTLI